MAKHPAIAEALEELKRADAYLPWEARFDPDAYALIVRVLEAFEPSQDALRLCECELTTYSALAHKANAAAWQAAVIAARAALTLAGDLPEPPKPEPVDGPTVDDLDSAIASYCAHLTDRAVASDVERLRFEPDPRGKKYTRIVRVTLARESDEVISRSVHSFVERATGDIWKAAGWKAPALNFPRGNVYNLELNAFDLFRIS